MSSKKKIAAVVLTTVALSISTVGAATASNAHAKSMLMRQSASHTSFNSKANPMSSSQMGGHEAELKTILAGLVTNKVITQAQSDAILAAVAAARTEHDANEDQGQSGNDGFKHAQWVAQEALIASTLGMDTATVRTRLAAGETLGAIAGAKKAALIAALVADVTKNIDAAVTAGKLTAEKALSLKAGLVEQITAAVDSVKGPMGQGMGKGGHEKGDKKGDHKKGKNH